MTQPRFKPEAFKTARMSPEPPNTCVHVARGLGWVIVRDTKEVFGSDTDYQFGFKVDQFDRVQAAIRTAGVRGAIVPAGVLDGLCISIERTADDVNLLRSTTPQEYYPVGTAMVFNDAELVAFFDGVHKHEFDHDGEHTAHFVDCAENCGERHLAVAAAV